MEFWKGRMDWPLEVNWRCEVCGVNHGDYTMLCVDATTAILSII